MTVSVGPISDTLWQGLSSDTKPGAADQTLGKLKINDIFFEKDTYKYYLWDGSAWNATTSGAGTGGTPP